MSTLPQSRRPLFGPAPEKLVALAITAYFCPQPSDMLLIHGTWHGCHRINTFNDEPNEKKSVLVFLPGLAEIFQFIDYLAEFYDRDWLKKNLELIPLHSSLNEEE